MKKLAIILAILVVALAIAGYFIISHLGAIGEDSEEPSIIEYGNQKYYEPEYQEGNTPDRIGGLSYKIPDGFTPINSDTDSVIENCFINTTTGTQLSITEEKNKSASYCENLSKEYLDGAEDVEKFNVGNYTCYKYNYKEDGQIIESDFHMIVGSTFYSGLFFHPAEVKDIQSDEPEPIPLTDEEIAQFEGLCKSLSVK